MASRSVRMGAVGALLVVWGGQSRAQSGSGRPGWPFGGELVLKQCGSALPIREADPFYRRMAPKVIRAMKDGLACLKANPNTPGRAGALERHLQRNINHTFFFMCTATEMNAPSNACGASRPSLLGGALVQFVMHLEDPKRCGCAEGVIFHEMIHVTSGAGAHCPAYRCEKECFACAVPVPDSIDGEDCTKYPQCCDP